MNLSPAVATLVTLLWNSQLVRQPCSSFGNNSACGRFKQPVLQSNLINLTRQLSDLRGSRWLTLSIPGRLLS